jgi:hypothetical protein
MVFPATALTLPTTRTTCKVAIFACRQSNPDVGIVLSNNFSQTISKGFTVKP